MRIRPYQKSAKNNTGTITQKWAPRNHRMLSLAAKKLTKWTTEIVPESIEMKCRSPCGLPAAPSVTKVPPECQNCAEKVFEQPPAVRKWRHQTSDDKCGI